MSAGELSDYSACMVLQVSYLRRSVGRATIAMLVRTMIDRVRVNA